MMTEKIARKRLEFCYKYQNNIFKSSLVYFIIGGILLMLPIFFRLFFNNIIILGTSFVGFILFIVPIIQYYLNERTDTDEFRKKWGSDRWICARNNFYYYCAFDFMDENKIYDKYFYGKKTNFDLDWNTTKNDKKEYEFLLLDEKLFSCSDFNYWRFATEKEMIKHKLDAYTAQILLKKDDEKYLMN